MSFFAKYPKHTGVLGLVFILNGKSERQFGVEKLGIINWNWIQKYIVWFFFPAV